MFAVDFFPSTNMVVTNLQMKYFNPVRLFFFFQFVKYKIRGSIKNYEDNMAVFHIFFYDSHP